MSHPFQLPQPLLTALAARFGGRFSTSAAVREHHGKDESSHALLPSDAVIFARSTTEEVSAAAALCHEYKVPVILFGTGTSLEGHLPAVNGGVSIDLSQMNRVLAIRPQDLDATVEAGVTRNYYKLLAEYEDDLALILTRLDTGNLASAQKLAGSTDQVRDHGHARAKSALAGRQLRERARAKLAD